MLGRSARLILCRANLDSSGKRWDQGLDVIGRILRAHLYVEYYLTESLVKANRRLGSVDQARLSFWQKLELLDQNAHPLFSEMLPASLATYSQNARASLYDADWNSGLAENVLFCFRPSVVVH